MHNVADALCAVGGLQSGEAYIHRDLKKENVMLVKENTARRAVLVDFGLAVVSFGGQFGPIARIDVGAGD